MANLIQKAAANQAAKAAGKQSITAILNNMLDGEAMRKRFDELLGARAPQFISSIISLVNADASLQQAIYEAPNTVIQAALRAASYDLPIDPGLGYAYILAFRNKKKLADGGEAKVMEASFIMGYRGMEQLAIRSGAYSRLPESSDVREGELIKYDRLKGDFEFSWIEDEEEREKKPIIGYAAYFRLLNGAEKTIYMTKKQIEKHERENRKGKYMGKGWRENWDAMAEKTVLRRLVGRYGIMSIDYRMGPGNQDLALARAVALGDISDEEPTLPGDYVEGDLTVDESTGEVDQNAEEDAVLPWEAEADHAE